MILITAATSQFGQAAIGFLLEKGIPTSDITAMVRDEAKAEAIKAKGISLVKGDYTDYDSLVKGFAGIDKMLFISSGEVVGRAEQHLNVVKAAKQAGVKYVLYTSFERKNETETSPIAFVAQGHLRAEKALKESGLLYTLFRNNIYMDYIPFFIGDKVLETGTIYLPAADGKGAYALRSEMAEAAANVLTSTGHEGKTYAISNIEKYTYRDVANMISEIARKEINYVSPTAEEFIKTLTDLGVPKEGAEASAAFSVAIAQGEFDKTTHDLENLLGRKPTGLKQFLTQVYSTKN